MCNFRFSNKSVANVLIPALSSQEILEPARFCPSTKSLKKYAKYFHNAAIQENIRNSKKDEFEWLDLFEENKTKAQTLKSQIETTEKAIDKMVYELYGLSEEEIGIVEGN